MLYKTKHFTLKNKLVLKSEHLNKTDSYSNEERYTIFWSSKTHVAWFLILLIKLWLLQISLPCLSSKCFTSLMDKEWLKLTILFTSETQKWEEMMPLLGRKERDGELGGGRRRRPGWITHHVCCSSGGSCVLEYMSHVYHAAARGRDCTTFSPVVPWLESTSDSRKNILNISASCL